jgi:hypothetical protein
MGGPADGNGARRAPLKAGKTVEKEGDDDDGDDGIVDTLVPFPAYVDVAGDSAYLVSAMPCHLQFHTIPCCVFYVL